MEPANTAIAGGNDGDSGVAPELEKIHHNKPNKSTKDKHDVKEHTSENG
jgi:hypothetical protein